MTWTAWSRKLSAGLSLAAARAWSMMTPTRTVTSPTAATAAAASTATSSIPQLGSSL